MLQTIAPMQSATLFSLDFVLDATSFQLRQMNSSAWRV